MTRHTPLLTLVITTTGEVEVEPGEGFNEDHLDLMVRAVEALRALHRSSPPRQNAHA